MRIIFKTPYRIRFTLISALETLLNLFLVYVAVGNFISRCLCHWSLKTEHNRASKYTYGWS